MRERSGETERHGWLQLAANSPGDRCVVARLVCIENYASAPNRDRLPAEHSVALELAALRVLNILSF